MHQIRKIVEIGSVGFVKDPKLFSEFITRKKREIYLVADHSSSKSNYDFLLILKDGGKELQPPHDSLKYYGHLVDFINETGKIIVGLFSVKKNIEGNHTVIFLWSHLPQDAVILYTLGVTIWKNLVSNRGDAKSVENLLKKFRKIENSMPEGIYSCREEMENLPYDKDVSLISFIDSNSSSPIHQIARKIDQVHEEMYFQHDKIFDEMQIMGLNLQKFVDETHK